MNVSYKQKNSTLNVSLSGEIDESVSAELRNSLDAVFSKPTITKIILDLSEVTFMDSSGIGVLIGRYKSVRSRGIMIFIKEPTKTVDKILLLSGIYEIMPKIVS